MKKIMKLAYKKMLAFVLVFVMLTGTVGTIGDVKAAEPTAMEITGVAGFAQSNGFDIKFSTSVALPGTGAEWSTFYNGPDIIIGGTSYDVGLQKQTSTQLGVYLTSDQITLPITDGTVFTVPAGTYEGTDGSKIVFAKDYSIEFDSSLGNSGWDQWRPYVAATPMEITGVAGFAQTNAWDMSLDTSVALPGSGAEWSTYYHGPDIIVDGTSYDVGLQKRGASRVGVYLTSEQVTLPVADGTVITVPAGKYYGTDGSAILFEKAYSFVYDSKAGTEGWQQWLKALADTGIEGDVDANEKLDTIDLIRLMRYNAGQSVLINRTAADVNRNGVIDKKDESALRKLLVGRLSYTDSEDGMPTGVPYYNNTDKIIRMAHACPEPKDFAAYKDAGLNTLNSEGVADVQNDNPRTQTKVTNYLTEAAKYDLDVLLYSAVINHLLRFEGDIDTEGNFTNWRDILGEYISVYSAYPAFAGFVLSDELPISSLSNYTKVVTYLKKTYPNLILRLPQLPVYTTEIGSLTTNTSLSKEDAYKDYVRSFGNVLGCFTYDHYPLYYKALSGYLVDEDWLSNLRWVSEVAKESNLYTGVTIQTCAKASSTNRYAPEQKSDIGFQIYTAMAFGMQEIGYYTYGDHKGDTQTTDSISENDSVRTAVQSVNQELVTFEHVFKAFTWKQTLELASGATNSSTNDGNLTSVQSTSIASYVGCMRDAEGYYGYMVANAEGPRTSTNGSVTLTFKNATHAQVYHNGKCETKELTENKLTVDLSVGEGAFVIPYIAK